MIRSCLVVYRWIQRTFNKATGMRFCDSHVYAKSHWHPIKLESFFLLLFCHHISDQRKAMVTIATSLHLLGSKYRVLSMCWRRLMEPLLLWFYRSEYVPCDIFFHCSAIYHTFWCSIMTCYLFLAYIYLLGLIIWEVEYVYKTLALTLLFHIDLFVKKCKRFLFFCDQNIIFWQILSFIIISPFKFFHCKISFITSTELLCWMSKLLSPI